MSDALPAQTNPYLTLNYIAELEVERDRLAAENAKLWEFVDRAAYPRRADGTYNHSREALEQQARVLLGGQP